MLQAKSVYARVCDIALFEKPVLYGISLKNPENI